jgi:hypothetical protein
VFLFFVNEPVKTARDCSAFSGGNKMKTAIMALSAATLLVAAPVFAQSASSKAPHHALRAKHKTTHPGTYGYATGTMQASGPKKGYYYPSAPAYAPTRDITDITTSGGGGGGGGGGY